MLPPCFHLADDVFPKVRAEAARRLVAHGWSQVKAADALRISQGMVSKHVAAQAPKLDALAVRLTEELVRGLTEGEAPVGPSAWCATLSVGTNRSGGDEALADLLEAEARLRRAAPLRFMPQIGLNVARALPDARTPDDILSYPGRLVDAGGALVAPAPPAFGASGHLARCLLHVRTRAPEVLALANVRGGADAARKARALGWTVTELASAPADAERRLRTAVEQARQPATVLHDAKALGIEPCLYVGGRDAMAVADLILALES